MAIAIIETPAGFAGVDVRKGRAGLSSDGTPVPIAQIAAKQLRHAVAGVPWRQVVAKRVSLPPMLGGELRRALDLQLSFHYPKARAGGLSSLQHRAGRRGVEALILGAEPLPPAGAGVTFPEPLAYYAVAARLQLLPQRGAALIVAFAPALLQTVMVVDQGIVLVREVPNPGNLRTELRLSMQSLFLAESPELVEPETVVWFGDPPPVDAIAEGFQPKLKVIPLAQVIEVASPVLSPVRYVAAAGLATCASSLPKSVRGWRLVRERQDWRSGSVRNLACAAVAAVVLGTGGLWWSTHGLAQQLQDVQKQQSDNVARRDEVKKLELATGQLQAFLAGDAVRLQTNTRWRELLNLLADKKPGGLALTSTGGQFDREIAVRGKAESYDQVTGFMQSLRGAKDIRDVRLVSTRQSVGGDVEFDLALSCAAPAPAGNAAGPTQEHDAKR